MNHPNSYRRRTFGVISLMLVTSLACNLGVSQPTATQVPAQPSEQPQSTPISPATPPALTNTPVAGIPPTQTLTSLPRTQTPDLTFTAGAEIELSQYATFQAGPLSRTQPAPNKSLTMFGYYSFQPLTFGNTNDNYWIRHYNFLGEITQVSTALDYADATFKVVPGFAQGDCLSFESYNFPGFFLRHKDFRIRLDQSDGSQLFQEDATFCAQVGLGHPLGISFRSYTNYGYYLRHRDFHLYVEAGTDDQFRADATFVAKSPLTH